MLIMSCMLNRLNTVVVTTTLTDVLCNNGVVERDV